MQGLEPAWQQSITMNYTFLVLPQEVQHLVGQNIPTSPRRQRQPFYLTIKKGQYCEIGLEHSVPTMKKLECINFWLFCRKLSAVSEKIIKSLTIFAHVTIIKKHSKRTVRVLTVVHKFKDFIECNISIYRYCLF